MRSMLAFYVWFWMYKAFPGRWVRDGLHIDGPWLTFAVLIWAILCVACLVMDFRELSK